MEQQQHSRLRPSQAFRWMECPASQVLRERINPPEKVSRHAEEGKRLHQIIEYRLREGSLPEDATAKDGEVVEKTLEISHNQRGGFANWLYEQQLSMNVAQEDLLGTVDALGIDEAGKRACVLDWKFGQGIEVRVWNNPQLLIYALMCTEYFARHDIAEIQSVEICIVQPRFWNKSINPLRKAVYNVEYLLRFRERLEKAIPHTRDTREGSEQFSPQPELCRFCPVKEHCPKAC